VELELNKAQQKGWKLLDNANRLAPFGSALQKCGLVPININVKAIEGEHGPIYKGLKECRSAWACPRCTPARSAYKGEIFNTIHNEALGLGYKPIMLTYTIQHKKGENLKDLLSMIKECWRNIFKGKRGKRFLKIAYGYISCIEITHGKNGWHPHFHVLFYLKKCVPDENVKAWLIEPYTDKLMSLGKVVRRITVNITEWHGGSDYLTKGSMVSELTGQFNKDRSRNIMDILSNAKRGNQWHNLYLEFINATKGVKAINTSGQVTARYKELDQAKKLKRKEAEKNEIVLKTFSRSEWMDVVSSGLRYEVLAVLSADNKNHLTK
jgi:hypothetical protein